MIWDCAMPSIYFSFWCNCWFGFGSHTASYKNYPAIYVFIHILFSFLFLHWATDVIGTFSLFTFGVYSIFFYVNIDKWNYDNFLHFPWNFHRANQENENNFFCCAFQEAKAKNKSFAWAKKDSVSPSFVFLRIFFLLGWLRGDWNAQLYLISLSVKIKYNLLN